MKRNIIAELMAEECIYGGLLATRGEVYCDLQSHHGPHGETISYLMIDCLVWMCKPALPEQADCLRSCGLTLAKIQAAESSAAQ